MPAPGDVVIVAFPFSDQSTFKRRPALVVADAGDGDLLLARITTADVHERFDVFLTEWQRAGLKRASWVRLAKLALIPESAIARTAGALMQADARNARRALLEWLATAWTEPATGDA